jgi:hypothetical protein
MMDKYVFLSFPITVTIDLPLWLGCLLTWGSPGRAGFPSLQCHYPDPSMGDLHRPKNCPSTQ